MSETTALAAALFDGLNDRGVVRIDADSPKELGDVATAILAALHEQGYRIVREDALDAVYADRNLVVQAFAAAMAELGCHVAWGEDEAEPDWPVLYIETHHGQVSWHIQKAERIYEPEDRSGSYGPMVWDGHTNKEKAERLARALRGDDHE